MVNKVAKVAFFVEHIDDRWKVVRLIDHLIRHSIPDPELDDNPIKDSVHIA